MVHHSETLYWSCLFQSSKGSFSEFRRLYWKLLENSLQELNEETKCIIRDSINELMATNKRSIEDIKENIHIKQLLDIVEKAAENGNFSRTARLWLQYIKQVKFILLYIQADRVGDWELHLYCIKSMILLSRSRQHSLCQMCPFIRSANGRVEGKNGQH
ncbi:hypothetical protein AVEN_37341-1 [Araneus ventricosus]|uniref:Uncharacterized protein n=1 Tax=Araneus ventricosus TaxID=182803 RepID=A0A4Y2RSN6_ARAVE|nr:hypothetical protein AVEN_191980-1 [Araneus ventricosus]GBN78376.1 hypothetical protein AVEN_37341-1 [Araneus ventricosus]